MGSSSNGEKKILLAEPRGYCAGVDRAVTAVERALAKFGAPIYVRKEIVHNKHVVNSLQEKGVIFVEEVDEVPEGSLLIFSAHGVSPQVKQRAAERNLRTIDATCPLVTKVHQEVKKYAKNDYEILLIGHKGHEEVEGTSGEAPDRVKLIDGEQSINQLEIEDPSKVVWLSQTTLSVDETRQTVADLKNKYPNLLSPPSDDICYATQNRQQAVKIMAAECDLVLVVGSQNSSNSKRLAEVAKQAGAKNSYLIDYAKEIEASWLQGVNKVGITSGASVPEILVQEVIDLLKKYEFNNIEKVKTTEESLNFALPRELRERRTANKN